MKKQGSSYSQIIKSTTIFAGSQVFIIIIGVIRTKVIAILLGTTGIGLIGIFTSIIDMMRSACGFGLDTVGVKEIAEANGSGSKNILDKRIARFNHWLRGSAVTGLIACILFCYPISLWAFGSGEYALQIAALSICVLLGIVTTGKSSVLQGMRKIPELAKSNILAAIVGLIVVIPLYFFLGIRGVIVAFIISYLASYICIEYFYRKLDITPVKISYKESFKEELSTLKLGLYIVISGFIGTASLFIVRAYITRNIDIEAAGLFQAAWAITNVYLGLMLRSMGSDFFPRLAVIAEDKLKIKELVNEQSYVILVIACPVIVGMLLFSDFALTVLYSSKFADADAVLRWQILGTFLKVLSWPIAFIILAKNKGFMFIMSEVIFFAVYLLSAYVLFPLYGLAATGIGYFIAYIIYLPTVFFMGRNISGFNWNANVIRMILVDIILIGCTFYIVQYCPDYLVIGGAIILAISLAYAYYNLKKVFSIGDLKDWFKKH